MFRPLNDAVLINVDDCYSKTTSGLFIPDNAWADQEPQTAEVVAVGNKVDNLKAGDKVIFIKFSGYKHPSLKEGQRIIRHAEIMAKVL